MVHTIKFTLKTKQKWILHDLLHYIDSLVQNASNGDTAVLH